MLSAPANAPSFYVKVNEDTNLQEIQQQGKMIAEIGFAVGVPAEYIVVIISRTAESLLIDER